MKKTQKKYLVYLAILSTVIVTIMFVFLYQIYTHVMSLVYDQYNHQQMILAKQTALGIERNIELLKRELEFLAQDKGLKAHDPKMLKTILTERFNYLKKFHVADITILNQNGILLFSLQSIHPTGEDFSQYKFFKEMISSSSKNPVPRLFPVGGLKENKRCIIISYPIFSNKGKINRLILFHINAPELIAGSFTTATEKRKCWAMETDGYILFHPLYKTGTIIQQISGLTPSFIHFLNQIRAGNAVKSEYISPEGEKEIVASAPIEIGNRKWALVIATKSSQIDFLLNTFVRKYSIVTTVLILFILSVFLVVILAFLKWNTELNTVNEQLQKEMKVRTHVEEKIRQQKDFLNTVIESLPNPFYVVDAKDFTIKIANSAAYKDGIAEGRKCYTVLHQSNTPCKGESHPCPVDDVKRTGTSTIAEHIHQDPKGELRNIELQAYPIFDSEGNLIQVIIYSQDITERRKFEDQLKASVEEKEILLGEIHHRVRNNLQVIYSLLSIQSDFVTEEKHRNLFRECQNQIMSMALVHEELYQTKNLARINFKNYLENLINTLFISYGIYDQRIKVKIDCHHTILQIDTAILCGLIINELVSNSLKHAFPDGREGEIQLSLRLISGKKYELLYRDNGIGIPQEIDFSNAETFGLQMINELVSGRLRGEATLIRNHGTEIRILFHDV